MPQVKFNSMLKKGRYATKKKSDAGVFMAATMEYLTEEILDKAGKASKK